MTWPFISRTTHALTCDFAAAALDLMTVERTYWRTRAERLMDAALARANAIHEPTMVDRKIDKADSPASVYTAALSISEFDSTKGKGTGHTRGI